MRKNIETKTFAFDNQQAQIFFYKSLLFSTQCKYIFKSAFQDSGNAGGYIAFANDKKNNLHEIHVDTFGRIKLGNVEDPQKINDYDDYEIETEPKRIKTSHYYLTAETNKNEYLFSCDWCADKVKNLYIDEERRAELGFIKNKRFKYTLSVQDESRYMTQLRPYNTNDLKALEVARLFGINVPLILVQELMNRRVRTIKLLDDNLVNYKELKVEVKASQIYIDLDETLIWDGEVVKITKKLYDKFQKKNAKITLITRHKKNVLKTLSLIDMSNDDFDNIIVVQDHELKSTYIPKNALFIDNEFPQRIDVRLNSGANVCDIDILDRIEVHD
jgi:hypothetical protein